MLELFAYLRANDFKTYIVSGGEIDAERECAYDRQSSFGKLDKALDEANAKGRTVVDMKNNWKAAFPPRP